MDKKIPKVYANKIEREVGNNDKIYYGSSREATTKPTNKLDSNLNINQKISQIFGSSRYVYKADVLITLKDRKVSKKIIGRNVNSLITIDNELINISDIVDIEYE